MRRIWRVTKLVVVGGGVFSHVKKIYARELHVKVHVSVGLSRSRRTRAVSGDVRSRSRVLGSRASHRTTLHSRVGERG
jgi:hypothetical protein